MPTLTRRRFLIGSAGASLAVGGSQIPAMAAQNGNMPPVKIGSKDYTEQVIVAEMMAALLEDAGYEIEKHTNLGGTLVIHEATVAGDVDAYMEYTGSGLIAILGQDLPERSATAGASPAAGDTVDATVGQDDVYDIVAETYPGEFGMEWLKPWGFNNTYVMAVRGETAEEFGLETISDLEGLAGDMTVGGSQEFLVRPDGLPGLEDMYGMEFGDTVGLDLGLLYSALDQGDVDIISATATDGRVPALGLAPLVDDLSFFPPYYAAPVVRQDLLEASPEIADVLNKMAGEMTDEKMANLNFRVDNGGEEAIDVARDFLSSEGYIDD